MLRQTIWRRTISLNNFNKPSRTLFGFSLKSKSPQNPKEHPILSLDDIFHPLSRSPIQAIRERGERIRSLAPCPVCLDVYEERRPVQFECPDCGWPTHATQFHWEGDKEHNKYCSRLREANEDEHDLRSGRQLTEFTLPGEQGYEETVSFANWDIYWFTRNHPSIDSERSRRHLTKLLTYPTTISSVLHEFSGLTMRNQRVTPEGARSLAALRTTLHQSPPKNEEEDDRRKIRIFILGARAESSLPPHVWQQLPYLFPGCRFHLFFIGPQVSLPSSKSPALEAKGGTGPVSPASGQPSRPMVYEPPTPRTNLGTSATRDKEVYYGVPSYTTAVSSSLSITSLRATYSEVHAQFGEMDPFQDVFFAFSPGFGFPSPTSPHLNQIQSPAEWGPVVPVILESKCPLFVTGFSPTDVERDVRSLDGVEGVSGEFDWIVTPGPNPFGSEKWEVADFDPRVMVKINWGIWGIRGKRREVRDMGFD